MALRRHPKQRSTPSRLSGLVRVGSDRGAPESNPLPLVRKFAAVWLLVLSLGVGAAAFAGASASGSGDPGGRILRELMIAESALPGAGTKSLPLVKAPSMTKPYVIALEPFQDSCDGNPSTRGWSQVVVQAGFPWHKSPSDLITYVGSRLSRLGWALMKTTRPNNPVGWTWFKKLHDDKRASVSLNKEIAQWEFVAQAPPASHPATGC